MLHSKKRLLTTSHYNFLFCYVFHGRLKLPPIEDKPNNQRNERTTNRQTLAPASWEEGAHHTCTELLMSLRHMHLRQRSKTKEKITLPQLFGLYGYQADLQSARTTMLTAWCILRTTLETLVAKDLGNLLALGIDQILELRLKIFDVKLHLLWQNCQHHW